MMSTAKDQWSCYARLLWQEENREKMLNMKVECLPLSSRGQVLKKYAEDCIFL